MRLSEIAVRLGAEPLLHGGNDPEIEGVATAGTAGPAQLVFAESEAALAAALSSRAGAVITSAALAGQCAGKPVLVAAQPKLAFAQAARLLREPRGSSGIHPTAVVGVGAVLGERVSVGACAVIEDGACIGAGTVIDAGAVIGRDVQIGAGCHLYPRVVVYPGCELGDAVVVHAGAVLGADGFGYVRNRATGEYIQFPQQGRLKIEDGVEIGANTTIDRGALETTRIGRGTKLDNLVHVGHNVQVGTNVVIAAQSGISGSSTVGDGAILGGQVGMGDHAAIGPGVILGGQAGVLPGKRLIGPGQLLWGTPAKPVKQYLRELATLTRLTVRRKSAE